MSDSNWKPALTWGVIAFVVFACYGYYSKTPEPCPPRPAFTAMSPLLNFEPQPAPQSSGLQKLWEFVHHLPHVFNRHSKDERPLMLLLLGIISGLDVGEEIRAWQDSARCDAER